MAEELEVAIKSGRVDVVRGFLSTLQEREEQEHKDLLDQVLKQPMVNGRTYLHLAAEENQFDIVRALLSSGCDPTVADSKGRLPYQVCATEKSRSAFRENLLQAASQSSIKQIKDLLKGGVEVNFFDTEESENTPLHWAASFADCETVECLCGHGADVHAVNKSGCSPLHDAVVRGNHDIVHCLLKYGADPALQITQGKYAGKTCYELAEGKKEVMDTLNNPPTVVEVPVSRENKLLNGPEELGARLPNGHPPGVEELSNTVPNTEKQQPKTPELMSPVFKRNPGIDALNKPPQVVTEEKLGLLWPQPQHIVQFEGSPFKTTESIPVYIQPGPGSVLRDIKKKWQLFHDKFDNLDVDISVEPLTPLSDEDETHILCHVNRRTCPGKGAYKINVMQNKIKVLANDCDALHFAISTILQLFTAYSETDGIQLPQLLIEDWPALPYRGVLFDISQGRVPNMDTIREVLQIQSMLKINQVYLYTRYRKLENLGDWQICFSMDQICELDELCHDYGMQLTPVIEVAPSVQYDDLQELSSVFKDFLTCFSFNEFVSVGPRLSSFLLDYEDDSLDMSDCRTVVPVRDDQTLQVCGYPLHDMESKLLTQLPPEIVFAEYGVQRYLGHVKDGSCSAWRKFQTSIRACFFICPGTAAWNSLAGCPEAAVTNVYNGVRCAASEGALGVVVCNWSGKGHVTHLPFSWPGFIMAAGLSWNTTCHWEYCLSNLEELLNLHVYRAETGVIGHAIVELGRAETYLLRCSRCQSGDNVLDLPPDNGSPLFQFLLQPDSTSLDNLTPEMLQRVMRHVKKCQTEIKDLKLKHPQNDAIITELQLTCDLMLLSVKIGRALVVSGKNPGGQAGCDVVNLGIANLSATVKTDLANKLLELIRLFEKLWLGRYLEHGVKYSIAGLMTTLKQLIPDAEERLQSLNNET